MSRFSFIFADLLDSLNQVSIQYETCNSIQVSVSSHSIHIYYLCFWDDTKKYCYEYEYLYVWVFITYMYCTNVLYFHMGRIPTIQPIDDVWLHKGAFEQVLFFNVHCSVILLQKTFFQYQIGRGAGYFPLIWLHWWYCCIWCIIVHAPKYNWILKYIMSEEEDNVMYVFYLHQSIHYWVDHVGRVALDT